MREFSSFKQYRSQGGLSSGIGGLVDASYATSGACPPDSKSPGECVASFSSEQTGVPYRGPTGGTLWDIPTFLPAPVCSRVIDLSNATQKALFMQLPFHIVGNPWTHYRIGGKLRDVPVAATAVGPQMRTATFYLPAFLSFQCEILTKLFPDGIGVNHEGHFTEANFEQAAWGANAPRLRELKALYDPDHIFNSYKTFGYLPECKKPLDQPSSAPTQAPTKAPTKVEDPDPDNALVIALAVLTATFGVALVILLGLSFCKPATTPLPVPSPSPLPVPVPAYDVENKLGLP